MPAWQLTLDAHILASLALVSKLDALEPRLQPFAAIAFDRSLQKLRSQSSTLVVQLIDTFIYIKESLNCALQLDCSQTVPWFEAACVIDVKFGWLIGTQQKFIPRGNRQWFVTNELLGKPFSPKTF